MASHLRAFENIAPCREARVILHISRGKEISGKTKYIHVFGTHMGNTTAINLNAILLAHCCVRRFHQVGGDFEMH